MRCDYTARSWGQHRAPSQGDFDPLQTTLTATIGDQPIQGITPNAKLYWYKKKTDELSVPGICSFHCRKSQLHNCSKHFYKQAEAVAISFHLLAPIVLQSATVDGVLCKVALNALLLPCGADAKAEAQRPKVARR